VATFRLNDSAKVTTNFVGDLLPGSILFEINNLMVSLAGSTATYCGFLKSEAGAADLASPSAGI
jgi:hypothetical protein